MPARYLANCPKDSQDFFTLAITESQQRGMHIYWGTTGFSLRAQDSMGKLMTIFYGFPSGGQSKDSAVVQGYVGDIKAVVYRDQVRQRLLAIPGTTASDQYTVILDLNAKTVESAKKLLNMVWDVSVELSKMNGPE